MASKESKSNDDLCRDLHFCVEEITYRPAGLKEVDSKALATATVADTLYVQEKFSASIDLYKKAIDIAPNVSSFHNNLGTAYLALAQYEQAIDAFTQAIKLDPHNSLFHANCGFALSKKGWNFFDLAIGFLTKAITLDANCYEAWANLAHVTEIKGTLAVAQEAKRHMARCRGKAGGVMESALTSSDPECPTGKQGCSGRKLLRPKEP
jgi:O-antigen biosynthesis protein